LEACGIAGDRQFQGVRGIIGKAAEHGLRTTEDVDALRLTPSDTLRDERKGVHASHREQRSLIGGDLDGIFVADAIMLAS
jgi:hypothetical protein